MILEKMVELLLLEWYSDKCGLSEKEERRIRELRGEFFEQYYNNFDKPNEQTYYDDYEEIKTNK